MQDKVLARAAELAGAWLGSLRDRPVGIPMGPAGLRERLGEPLRALGSSQSRPAVPRRRAELADSWAADAHKWLNVPYDCGLAIVRDPAALGAALGKNAAYLPASDVRDPFNFTPEASRRARALPVYAALRSLGRRGVAELIDRCCALARLAAAELASGGTAELLNDVVLNQVLFRVPGVDPAPVLERVQRDGTCWLGGTSWHGEPAIRFSVSNWSTTEDDIRRSAAAIQAAIRAAREDRAPFPD